MKRSKIFFLIAGAFFLFSCSKNQEKYHFIKGDDLGFFIFDDFIKEFNDQSKIVKYQFTGGGAQTGLFSLMDETVDVVFSLKELNNEDLALLKSKKINLEIIPIIRVPIIFISHKTLPIANVNQKQMKAIASGYTKYWWQMGTRKERNILAEFGEIEFASLDSRNGEYHFVRKWLNLNDFDLDSHYSKHNSEIQDYVSQNISSIGYLALPFYNKTEDTKIIFSDQSLESTGYLMINKNSFKQSGEKEKFIISFKNYLSSNSLNLLQKGIKVINETQSE
ncbi:MAG TPA: hypothetical protein DHW82_00015 [Spirochaetia bacterium]|nr:hypothetical protein [Spirochaetia bacterium]